MRRDYKVSVKKKGSVLVLMLAVVALILVLGTSLMVVNTSTYKVQVVNDTVSRVNYMAESGIQVALGKTNKTSSFHIVSNDNLSDIVDCNVVFQQNVPDSNHYTIVSTAYKGNTIRIKSRAVAYNSSTNPSTPSNNPFTNNVLNIYGDVDNPNSSFNIGNGSNTNVTINGSAYIQSYSTNIKSNLNVNNGGLTILSRAGNISFDNNGSTANISGNAFLQGNNITLSQNITVGTDTKPSGLTIRADNFINFDNNGTTSTIYGTTYVNSYNGIKMEQNFNVIKGDLIIDNANGNVEFTNNSNVVNVYGSSEINNNNGDILLRKSYIAGTSSHQSNLRLSASGNVDLYNTNKNISGNFYISSGSTGNNSTKISNTGATKVGGWLGFISKNDILNDWGNSNNISGDYYLQADNNININDNISNNYAKSYSVISGKNLSYANNDFSKENISGSRYLSSNNTIDTSRSTVSSPEFVAVKPVDLQRPQNSSKITNFKDNIKAVTNSNDYNVWNNTYTDLAFIKINGSDPYSFVNAVNSNQGNKYKLILINGDCNISDYSVVNSLIAQNNIVNIKNTIVYCTGKFKITTNPWNKINFDHSVVFANSFDFDYSNIDMTSIDQPRSTPFIDFTNNTASEINSILRNNIDGYQNIDISGN
jgi:hypothetical protein